MLFREHLCSRFWHRLGLQSCWFPWYWLVHPDIYGFALYAFYICLESCCGSGVLQPCPHGAPHGFSMVLAGPSRHLWLCLLVLKMLFREHLCARFWHRLVLGIRCFATMPHGAPQGFSMVLAGPSRHLGLCLLCLVYLPCILLCMPCNQRFRRCYFASISAHASGTALGFNPAGFHGTGWSIQTSITTNDAPK